LTLLSTTHWIAAMAVEGMIYCFAAGTVLAIAIALVLRLVPGKNSRTRFAVWFLTLATIALLPVVPLGIQMPSLGVGPSASPHPLVTLSSSWAAYILLGWAALSGLGLVRVFTSLWQIRRLRRGCVAIDPGALTPEMRYAIEEFSKRRPVSVLVSSRLHVPTAIGYLRPAILVPSWLVDSSQAQELKYVLLHELAHLRRWDDWTNLVQKLVKALLFFHPGVWWIERELSFDREMACDDRVLAETTNPRVYAECLTLVAEKSLSRRKMALAQAAVDRMRQLSERVTRILDTKHLPSTGLWKPAIPMVAALALVCAVSTSGTKNLVTVSDEQPAINLSAQTAVPGVERGRGEQVVSPAVANTAPLVHMAKFTPSGRQSQVEPMSRPVERRSHPASLVVPARYTGPPKVPKTPPASPAATAAVFDSPDVSQLLNSVAAVDGQDATPADGVVLLVVASERVTSAGSMTWHIVWEMRFRPTKLIPGKI